MNIHLENQQKAEGVLPCEISCGDLIIIQRGCSTMAVFG